MTFFEAHKFTLAALAQKDLNSSSDLVEQYSNQESTTKGGTLDTQYLTLKAEGPIVERLFYQAFTTFGTGSTLSWVPDANALNGSSYQYKPIAAFLGGGSLSYYVPEWLTSAFSARFLVASGDSKATSSVEGNVQNLSTLFVPITSSTLGVVFSPALSNLIYYELGGSLKPLPGQPLVAGAKLLGFQRAVAGVVNAPGVLRTGPSWMGEEFDVTASWPIFSDLIVSVAAGGFVPTANTYAPGSTGADFQYALKIGATLSL